jgi:hypothetical protein
LLLVICSVLCLVLYTLQQRFTNYLPTISETIVGWPNSPIFQIGSSVAATLFSFGMILFLSSLDCRDLLGPVFSVFGHIMTIFLPLVVVLVGNFTLEDSIAAHFLCAHGLFGGYPVFGLATLIYTWKSTSTPLRLLRIALVVVTAVSYAGITGALMRVPGAAGATLVAAFEYLFIAGMGVFLLSMKAELSRVQLSIVLTEPI